MKKLTDRVEELTKGDNDDFIAAATKEAVRLSKAASAKTFLQLVGYVMSFSHLECSTTCCSQSPYEFLNMQHGIHHTQALQKVFHCNGEYWLSLLSCICLSEFCNSVRVTHHLPGKLSLLQAVLASDVSMNIARLLPLGTCALSKPADICCIPCS